MIGAFVYNVGTFPEETLEDFYKLSIWGQIWFKIVIMVSTSIIVVLPLNLLKDVTKLRFTSIFGIFCLLLVSIIIIFQLPNYIDYYWEHTYNRYDKETWVNWYDISTAFTSKLYFFKGSATLFYAYNCHMGLFPVYEKLRLSSERRVNKVITRSILMDAFFYIIVGLTGYLTQPYKTPNFIIEREKIGNDIVMTIGRLLIVFLIVFKIPANYNALRISIFELFFGTHEIDNKRQVYFLFRNYLVTIPITIITAFIGAVYSDISEFMSLLGGFCGVIISFFFPCFIYIKCNEYNISHWKNVLTIIISSILCIIGVVAGIMSLITIITSFIK